MHPISHTTTVLKVRVDVKVFRYCCHHISNVNHKQITTNIKDLIEGLYSVSEAFFDLLESILCVLFQFTEESDFELVPDKQQLGKNTESE